jgi:hypothetical protein
MLIELARANERMAEYAYALVLYNLAWRLKQNKLSLGFGTLEEQAQNQGCLCAIAQAIPVESWLSSPDLNDVQRVYLMQRYGVVEHEGASLSSLWLGAPCVSIYAALRADEGLLLRGFVLGQTLTSVSELALRFAWEGGEAHPTVTFVKRTGDEVGDASQRDAWHFEVTLPSMDDKPYVATITGTAEGQAISAFSLVFDLCRCNGRRINAQVREFGDRRLTLAGSSLHVGTIKDLPAWTMPVVVRLMRARDTFRHGDYDQQEVRLLRSALPKALRDLGDTRLWLYVHAPKAYEQDAGIGDDVVRLRLEDLEGRLAKVTAFLGAERIVAKERDLKRLLPCSYQTWERIADFTARQTYVYVGNESLCLAGTLYDECRF